MLQAYSIGKVVAANGIVPFDNVIVDKGCSESLTGTGTIELNKCGVYLVSVNGSAAAETTLQLLRNGVSLPQAQSTGTSLGFETIVQVEKNNCQCNPCSTPVTIQVSNTIATTLNDVNVVVHKIA